MNGSLNILAKIYNLQKLRHGFENERALITMTLISSCQWKTLVIFCLRKKRPENALLQNRTEKQIMTPKTKINWLFTDIRCYLFIVCFDWKVGVYKQTVL